MAHKEAWSKVVEEGHELVLVLEDDMDVHDDFSKVITLFLRQTPPATDLLFLHNNPLQGEHITTDADQFIIEDPDPQNYVGAYFLTKAAATKLLGAFNKDAMVPLEQFIAARHNKFEDEKFKEHSSENGAHRSNRLNVCATNIQLVDLHFQSRRYDAMSARAAMHREL
jgi:GR25 family glycosyltransferase involved in LPS biosynthesis